MAPLLAAVLAVAFSGLLVIVQLALLLGLFGTVTAVVDSTTRAGYYPGAKPIRTKLIAERGTGRLLGAQIVGEEGAAKRIDVLSVALWHETPVEELLNIDLSYAPPFSPVWDPVLIAARKTWQAVETDRARTEPG